MIINSAIYGGKDVTDIVRNKVQNGELSLVVNNEIFGDPQPHVVKFLTINYNDNKIKSIREDEALYLADSLKEKEEYPFISCKCITYGRVDYLEESLESFIKQDYPGKKELVIVNDYPLQKLKFDHPDVKIINLDKTFETIGEKENFAVENCSAEIIAVWDDDDIAMPIHLRNIAKHFKEDSDLLHWHKGVLFNYPNIQAVTGLGNSGIVYSKKIWRKLGGIPLENAGYDMTFVLDIKRTSSNIVYANPEEVGWFYMWGGRGYHMSGQGTDTPDRPNVIKRHSDYVEQRRLRGEIPTGEIILNPNWKIDYKQILQNYLKGTT